MDLGNKIKNIRYNNNISQEKMADILNINRNYLSRIETNKSLPTANILVTLAKEFNISIDSLLDINNKDDMVLKANKINKINKYCNNLSNTELDLIINIICGMTNHKK